MKKKKLSEIVRAQRVAICNVAKYAYACYAYAVTYAMRMRVIVGYKALYGFAHAVLYSHTTRSVDCFLFVYMYVCVRVCVCL